MRKTKIAVMALLTLCLLAGATVTVGNIETLGAATQLSMSQPLTAQQVHALIQSDPSVVILDARGNTEYTGALPTSVSVGHIPGAYNNPDDGNAASQFYRFPEKNRPYICYCNQVTCPHAFNLASLMSASGYTNVTYMPGGVLEWAAQGYPFETGEDPGGVIPPVSSSQPPIVATGTAGNITNTGAKVSGSLTSKGTAASVTVSFEYGTTTSYGSTVAGVPATLSSTGAFIANLTGLTSGQTYHFRAKAVGDGTVYGNDATFNVSLNMEGDVNLDGYVTITDAMLIARFKAGLLILTEEQLQCADTTDDGIVSIADAMHISQWLVDPDGSLGVLFKPLWESPADDSMLHPIPK